ncbi:hypothetical protein F4677DRAFT_431474 [Hypoxylon crocopeplum]|nr:hypothetical protein F4677DRAFT_431474 [Hypoxylon crocopeplum]
MLYFMQKATSLDCPRFAKRLPLTFPAVAVVINSRADPSSHRIFILLEQPPKTCYEAIQLAVGDAAEFFKMAEANSSDPFFLNVPFKKRWDCHKDTIKSLYIDEGRSVENIATTMKSEYRFDANVRQYKYYFKKWGIFKSVPSSAKEKAIVALGKRDRDGEITGGVRYKGEVIDKKRLRRHINDQARAEAAILLSEAVFTPWNLPYKALRASMGREYGIPSPSDAHSTPSDISVFSPMQVMNGLSPNNIPSPTNVPSPTTLAVRRKRHTDRARFLIQGRHDDFLKDMPSSDKKIVTTWLHQFWLFTFKTVKHWGVGPTHWSPQLLSFDQFLDAHTSPNTPAATLGSPGDQLFGGTSTEQPTNHPRDVIPPSSLCFWSIHCDLPTDCEIPSDALEGADNFGLGDPEDWAEWTSDQSPSDLVKKLQDALESNSFSTINAKDLPLSTIQLADAARRSTPELTNESIAFAIMARNGEFLEETIQITRAANLDLTRLYPFHLATSYLDGARTCCDVVGVLTKSLGGRNLVKNLYINELGHTLIDNLMMSILKAHTSCTPSMVNDRFKMVSRFSGEEIDVCGRWDADSPCVRALQAQGNASIPFSWKHMFCHTSVQTVCHSIAAIFNSSHAPEINTPSGLFVRMCEKCNCKLQLGPLHSLVLTAFYLSQRGCENENLFGVLACLVCMLVHGANPLEQADISVGALMGSDSGEKCTHTPIDPVQLADQLPREILASWTAEVRLGWEVFLAVLRFAQQERRPEHTTGVPEGRGDGTATDIDYEDNFDFMEGINYDGLSDRESDDDEDHSKCDHDWFSNFYGESKDLGVLWAAIQTELLTYRRINDGDPWLSDRFSMRLVLEGLKNGSGFSLLPLVEQNMMKPFCKCGRFIEGNPVLATTTSACSHHFSNMDVWSRSIHLSMPMWAEDY